MHNVRREQQSHRKHGPQGKNDVGAKIGKGAQWKPPRTTEALKHRPRSIEYRKGKDATR